MTNTPDFSYKPDQTIISAFQNANQQRMQAEQIQRQEKQRKFQQTLDTTKAIGDVVSSMVQIAETRKTNTLIEQAKNILSQPKPSTTITPEGPTLEGQTLEQVPNPAVAQRQRALMNIAGKLAPKELGEVAAKEAFPTALEKMFAPQQSSIELDTGQIIPAVFKQGQYFFPNTDTPIPTERIKSRGYGAVPVETGSGAVEMVSRGTGRPISTVSTQNAPIPENKVGKTTELTGLEKKDRERAFTMIDTAKDDPLIKKNREVFQTISALKKAIETDDKVAMDRMGGLMHKAISQDVGNLAAWEQRDPNSRAYADRVKNWVSLVSQGKPAAETKEMILKTLNNMEQVASGVVDDSFNLHATSVVEAYPQLNKNAVLRKMGKEALKRKLTPDQEAEQFLGGF